MLSNKELTEYPPSEWYKESEQKIDKQSEAEIMKDTKNEKEITIEELMKILEGKRPDAKVKFISDSRTGKSMGRSMVNGEMVIIGDNEEYYDVNDGMKKKTGGRVYGCYKIINGNVVLD